MEGKKKRAKSKWEQVGDKEKEAKKGITFEKLSHNEHLFNQTIQVENIEEIFAKEKYKNVKSSFLYESDVYFFWNSYIRIISFYILERKKKKKTKILEARRT